MYRSETYVQNLLKGLRDLKERNVACDLTLASKDGASYPVHRIVMAAASSYFMLKMDHEISSGQIHVLRNVDASCLEALVNFAYTGEMDFSNIPKTAIWPLLAACTELQMTDALNLCHDYLAGNVSPQKSSKATSGKTVQSSSQSGLSIKMEVEAHNVKQEGDYDQGYDDDDNYPAADDTYYTGDNYTAGEGSPVVELTALEDDPVMREQYAEQLSSSPPKRKRGRPRKSDVAEPAPKRGRPSKQKTASTDVVEYSRAPRKRKSRKSASPARTKSKATKGGAKGRPRKRAQVAEKGEKCNICGKVVKLKSLLAAHYRIKHHRRTYTHDFHRKAEALGIYSKVIVQPDFESNRNAYGCSRCGEVFNMWSRWRKHYTQKHLNSRYQCVKCKIGFSYPLDLLHHKHRKHKARVVLKKRAGIKLQDLSGSSSGRKKGQEWISMVNLPQAATEGENTPSRNYQCNLCGKTFSQERYLTEHTKRVHLKRRYQCNFCQKSYANNRDLKEHTKTIHLGELYRCKFELCGKSFQSKQNLDHHVKVKHTGRPSLTCELCGKGFWNNTLLEGHMNEHMGLRPYECDKCGRAFHQEAHRRRHAVSCGQKEKTEKCAQCGMAFVCKRYLRNHIRVVHETSEKHLCNACGKAFKYKQSLIDHMARHHTTAPFECDVCGEKRLGMIKFHRHMKIHERTRFECDLCDKSYSREADYREHKKTIHEGKPYECKQCDRRFYAKKRFVKHLKLKHEASHKESLAVSNAESQ